jgi:hypothetical protein
LPSRTLTKKYEEKGLLVFTFTALAVLYALSGYTATIVQHAIMMIPLGMASGISNTLVSSLVSKEVRSAR